MTIDGLHETDVERVARTLVRSRGAAVIASDEHWPGEVARYRKMAAEHGDGYTSARSLITDAFRDARIALEVMRNAGRPIDAGTPKNRRILLWSPTRYAWRFGRWNDDRHAIKPRPFWAYDGERTTESRATPPTHWQEEPPSPGETDVSLLRDSKIGEDR